MLTKQPVNIPFALGVDTKTDKWQLNIGNFASLINSVFTTGKQLTKRNGFKQLTALPPNSQASTLTTFNGNLLAIGNAVYAYNNPSNQWSNQGKFQSMALSVQPLIRTAYSNTICDAAVASNGLVCVAFLDGDGQTKFAVEDSTTGQSIVPITNLINNTATAARVFTLGNYFILSYLATIAGGTHLQYISIPIANPANYAAPIDITTSVNSLTSGYDGASGNNAIYFAWANGTGGITSAYLTSTLTLSGPVIIGTGHTATLLAVAVDNTQSTAIVWITAYSGTSAFTWAVNQNFVPIVGPIASISGHTLIALAASATSTSNISTLKLFYEVSNTYSYSSVRTDFINKNTVTQSGSVGTETTVLRSVGLASKAFIINGVNYMMTIYGQSFSTSFEPTYFLIDEFGNIVGKLAQSNGFGYAISQVLPKVQVTNGIAQVSYLYADQIQAVNSQQGISDPAGVYAQTGVNLATWNFNSTGSLSTAEIGGSLHIAGGFLWMYDGIKPVEHNFHVWPESIVATPHTSGGSMIDQQYFYQVTYEWTDGSGNIHRSAPSIPVSAVVSGGGGAGSVTLNIPTLRLTYKISPNQVRIVIYRWSAAQESYFQITSVTSPLLNITTSDSVTYVDTQSDAAILGNNLIYTTGGVIENIAAPACSALSLFKSRLVLLDSEDNNLWWYSKQVIEATPVEMSDLFTEFLAPTSGAQGSTGELSALAPMDDKLIFYKKDAEYYIVGSGPDNTGANNDFTDPIFIASTVGSVNQASIVLSPMGLMSQSDKGIWMVGRDLSTQYIGAPVEGFNGSTVTSAICAPGTNQVRFTIAGTLSSTLFQGMHTILDANGVICQEQSNQYLDNTQSTMLMYDYYYQQWGEFLLQNAPVTMGFTTGWINLAGIQGYERAYYFYLLGNFISPHKLQLGIAYNYNPAITQAPLITPDNYGGLFGSDTYNPIFGDFGPFGNTQVNDDSPEMWRIFLDKQKCMSFQLSMQEVFYPSYNTAPGAGLTLSGLNLVVGLKKGFRPIPASRSTS